MAYGPQAGVALLGSETALLDFVGAQVIEPHPTTPCIVQADIHSIGVNTGVKYWCESWCENWCEYWCKYWCDFCVDS